MQCKTTVLRDALLRVWTPAVGAKSIIELIESNVNKMVASQGINPFSLIMIMDLMPTYSTAPCPVDLFFDDRPPFEIDEVTLSGSWSEGLFFYGSTRIGIPDVDQMCVLKHISFSKDEQQAGNITLREDTPFVYARITDEDKLKMWSGFLVDQDNSPGKRLSSKKLKEKLQENYDKLFFSSEGNNPSDVGSGAAMCINKAHNLFAMSKSSASYFSIHKLFSDLNIPSLHVSLGELLEEFNKSLVGCDIVLSIQCDGWPSCANEWTTRDRIWPCDDITRKITNKGFHIVPKSSTEGDFRLSFSYAETTLIENLTELQHKVLRSFKAVVKYHQNSWSPNIKEIITTYHLKTVAFWHFEKIAQDFFTEESVAHHLVLLLQELGEALRKRELPMYFMPKVNLFSNVEDPEEAFDIAEKIEQLCLDFSQIIKAIENITIGFGPICGILENTRKFCENAYSLRGHKKGSETVVPTEKMKKIATVCDNLHKLVRSNLLNPMTGANFATHNDEEETQGTTMPLGFK